MFHLHVFILILFEILLNYYILNNINPRAFIDALANVNVEGRLNPGLVIRKILSIFGANLLGSSAERLYTAVWGDGIMTGFKLRLKHLCF